MKKLGLCVAVVSPLIAGSCASYSTMMVHPDTGDVEPCYTEGAGLIPMAMAKQSHDECVAKLRALGYQSKGSR